MCSAGAPGRTSGGQAGESWSGPRGAAGGDEIRRRQGGAWGLLVASVGLVALLSPVFESWWGVPAVVGGIAAFVIRADRRAMLLSGSTLWLLALTGLPIAGRPVALLSTVLAFAGTRALREWSGRRRAARAERAGHEGEGADEDEQPPLPPSLPRGVRQPVSAGLVLGILAWAGGIVGAVTLGGTWTGRFQIFPGLDIALAGAQVGTAAGLAAAIDSRRSRLAAIVPLGLSIIALGMLFWLFFLSP